MDNLNTKQAVRYLNDLGVNFTERTLSVWRCLGRGPRFKKIGRKVYYEPSALDQFAEGRLVETADSLDAR